MITTYPFGLTFYGDFYLKRYLLKKQDINFRFSKMYASLSINPETSQSINEVPALNIFYKLILGPFKMKHETCSNVTAIGY